MWKLVKAELDYVKPWILTSSIIFFLLITFDKFTLGRFNIYSVGMFMVPHIVLVCILINFVMVYFEVKESRLRLSADLPMPGFKLGLARALTPAALLVIFLLLAVFNDPRIPETVWHFWLTGGLIRHGPQRFWFPHTVYNGHAPAFIMMFFTVFATRLITETYGRILLVIFALVLVLAGYIIPIFNQDLADLMSRYLFPMFTGNIFGYYLLALLTIISIIINYISFIRRSSYLA